MRAIYLPSNLDLEDLLKASQPEFKYDLDKFKYLVGTVVKLKARNKGNTEKEVAEYIPLNSTYLQGRMRDYNQYLKYLVDNGVLETDGIYIPGEKSRGYKLADRYEEQELISVEITNRVLIRKRPEDLKKERLLKRHYEHLTKWFNENLQIDHAGAEAYLKELLTREEKTGDKKAKMKYRLRQLSIDRIRNGDFDYAVDDTGKRFHSNLTNLKSGLRNFITYAGQTLCSIDVKNSQPFISTILFNQEFYAKEKGKLNLFTLSPNYYSEIVPFLPEIISILSNHPSPIMLVKDDETQASSDLELFCTIVDKGRLYPYISERYEERTGTKLNPNIPDEKKKLKDAIFLTFFSHNSFYKHRDAAMKRFFNELFPTVYRIFSLIKEDGHERLPIILQLVESEIMLKRVAKSICKNKPKLPIYTIHDSIVTLADHKEMVRDVVKREFYSAIGLEPSLSFEMWTH
jgi:hypothetical protein